MNKKQKTALLSMRVAEVKYYRASIREGHAWFEVRHDPPCEELGRVMGRDISAIVSGTDELDAYMRATKNLDQFRAEKLRKAGEKTT